MYMVLNVKISPFDSTIIIDYKQVEDLTENRDILNKYTISLFLEM